MEENRADQTNKNNGENNGDGFNYPAKKPQIIEPVPIISLRHSEERSDEESRSLPDLHAIAFRQAGFALRAQDDGSRRIQDDGNKLIEPVPIISELLFKCVWPQAQDAVCRDEIDALLKRGADLEDLCLLAADHHVSSLVYKCLKACAPSLPSVEKAVKSLRVSCLALSAANSFYKKELMRILASFSAKGIAVIPLKGILLSEYLYGDAESRDRSVDIDLLVKEETLERARSLLEDIGYTFKPTGEIEEYMWSYSFIKPGMPAVDLHWDITMMVRSRERIEGLWSGTREVALPGATYYYFKPEELLLYLSAHLVNSGAFRQLRHLRDIDQLIRKYGNEIDWNSVIRKARQWRLSGSLYAALALVRQFENNGDGFNYPAKKPQIIEPVPIISRLFIRIFADKKVVVGGGFRRRLLDAFLGYTFFEIIEANSLKEYLSIFKRIFAPPKEIVGERGYGSRVINGAVKLAKKVIK